MAKHAMMVETILQIDTVYFKCLKKKKKKGILIMCYEMTNTQKKSLWLVYWIVYWIGLFKVVLNV